MPKTQRKSDSIQNRKKNGKSKGRRQEVSIWPFWRKSGHFEVASVRGRG